MTASEANGYGTLSVFIICLCSILGALVLPCVKTKVYLVFMAIFMGLAVGTLAGDALFHLLPEGLGVHGDEHEEEEEEHEGVEPFVWISLVAFLGLYGFYLLEMLMTLLKNRNVKTGTISGDEKQEENQATTTESDQKSTDDKEETFKQKISRVCSPLVVMIIFGDAIHNFLDGLAIGAAFASSNLEGLSTSIAVFCHELPHELGDFAVLMSSGMGITWALASNFLSSLTAFLGLYIGAAVATDELTKQYIFALTAGMFLYIALVDLMPELVKQGTKDLKYFAYHNIGIFVGALILFLLSVFEEKIEIE